MALGEFELIERILRRPQDARRGRVALGGTVARSLDDRQHAVRSRFFEVQGRLRMEQTAQQEWALIERDGAQTRMLWRARAPGFSATTASLQ